MRYDISVNIFSNLETELYEPDYYQPNFFVIFIIISILILY